MFHNFFWRGGDCFRTLGGDRRPCQSQFTPKMKANTSPRLHLSLVWIDQYNECNGMTSFMEFMGRRNLRLQRAGCPTDNCLANCGCPAQYLVVSDNRKPLISNTEFSSLQKDTKQCCDVTQLHCSLIVMVVGCPTMLWLPNSYSEVPILCGSTSPQVH